MKELIDLLKNKKVAFLENGNSLEEECEVLATLFKQHNIQYEEIFDIEDTGLADTLKKCRDVDVLIFETTWTYPVSKELKKAFMSIQNPEFKKTFIEVYVHEPTFWKMPNGVIHDIYILDGYKLKEEDEFVFEKLV